MGSAAIVGNDRITAATLDTQVSNLKQSGFAGQIPATEQPKAVLGWMISFAVRDRTAQDAGITVSDADIELALAALQQQTEQNAQTALTIDQVVAANGVPPDMAKEFGQWYAQLLDFFKLQNGGTIPSQGTAAFTTANSALVTADCQSAKALGVQVNPQYGQLAFQANFSIYGVVAGNDTLSRPAGTLVQATTPALPSC
jgi:hypothetical protein